jgi:hypothetical protein
MMMGEDANGMAGVTVKKAELLDALLRNRSEHRALFLEAQNGYREDAIRELDAMLAEARSGKAIRRAVALVEPKDHTRDYDRVIKMLEMCTKDEVFIDESEFAQYVQDDWGWKNDFVGTASNYTNRH